jgi:hypothetical protein
MWFRTKSNFAYSVPWVYHQKILNISRIRHIVILNLRLAFLTNVEQINKYPYLKNETLEDL